MKGCQCKKGCQCERVAYSKLPRPNIQLNCRHCRSCLILPAASNPRFLKQTFSLTAKIHGFFYSCLPANFQTLILPLVFVCPTSDTNSSSCAFVHWHEMFCPIVRMQDLVRADWQGDLQLPLQPNSHPLTVFPSLHHDLSSLPMISLSNVLGCTSLLKTKMGNFISSAFPPLLSPLIAPSSFPE